VDTFAKTTLKSSLRLGFHIDTLPIHEYWIYSTQKNIPVQTKYFFIRFKGTKDTTGFATARARRCDIPLFFLNETTETLTHFLYFFQKEIPKDFYSSSSPTSEPGRPVFVYCYACKLKESYNN
jgi:hypothetical protein